MLRASGMMAELWIDQLPLLAGALELAGQGVVPGGTRRNLENASLVEWDEGIAEPFRILAADAQTSGGLLIAIAEDRHHGLVSSLRQAGTLAAATVGVVRAGMPGRIVARPCR
jgi:selenide,water dikinase